MSQPCPECEDAGICLGEDKVTGSPICSCLTGFSGATCEFKTDVKYCPNNHTCFNGSTCVKNVYFDETQKDDEHYTDKEYICNCAKTYDYLQTAYSGDMCDQSATSYCEMGMMRNDLSKKSFCTNMGTCKSFITLDTNEKHMGCECSFGYEGQHCQYEEGTEPPESVFNAYDRVGDEHQEIFAVYFLFFFVFFGLLFSICFSMFTHFYVNRRNALNEIDCAGELTLDPDGGTLPRNDEQGPIVGVVVDTSGDGDII